MPKYQVTQDSTGITLELEGDRPPTQADVTAAFAAYGAAKYPQSDVLKGPPTLLERIGRQEVRAPAGSIVDQEGVMGLLSASKEKREAFREAGEAVGGLVGPKTAAAAGVIGETAANLLSPMSLMTLGVAGSIRSLTTVPQTLRAIEGAASASDLLAAARAAKTAQYTERAAVAAFAVPTAESAVASTRRAANVIGSEAPPEEKVRAATEAGVSLLFAGLLGAGGREVFKKDGQLMTQAQAMEAFAGQRIQAREAANNLARIRDEVAALEATMPKPESLPAMTPDEFRAETARRDKIEQTKKLMDQALNEAMFPKAIDTGEMSAMDKLKASEREVVVPEPIGGGPRPEGQPKLSRALEGQEPFVEPVNREIPIEAEAPATTPLRTAAEIQAERQAKPVVEPIETAGQKLATALEQNDQRVAAEAITQALESGAAQGEPPAVTRKLIEAQLGIGKRRVGKAVAEEIITRETEQARIEAERNTFNQLWDAELNKIIAEEKVKKTEQEARQKQITDEEFRRRREEILAKNPRLSNAERRALEAEAMMAEQPPMTPVEEPIGQYPPEGFGTGTIPGAQEMARRAEVRRQVAEKNKAEAEAARAQAAGEQPAQPQGRFSQAAEGLTQSLENLRVDVTPGVGSLPIVQFLGQSWNGALVVAQSMIKGGAKVADAIEKAVRYVKYDFKGNFDEAQLRSALASALSESPKVIPGQGQKARTVSQRVATSSEVPLEVRQQVAASPESSYTPQKMKEVSDTTSMMANDQLTADLADATSNTRVASGIELFNRKLNSGDTAGALDLATNLSKSGTQLGQLVNQFKLLKSSTPEGLIALVDSSLKRSGKKGLTPELANKLKAEMEVFTKNRDALDAIDNEWADAANSNAPQETIDSIKSRRSEVKAGLDSASVDLNLSLAKANPASAVDVFVSTVQGSVMSPLSTVRNIIGNTINVPMRELADASSAIIDKLVTGGKNNTYDINARTIGRLNAFVKSLPEAKRILLKGSDAMPYEIGKDTGNPLNFQRAWSNIYDAITAGTVESKSLLAKDVYAGTLGIFPDLMLRLAQVTDIPFKAAQRAATIEEFGRRVGLSEKQIDLAKSNIEKLKITDEQAAAGRKGLTQDQIDTIEFESARAVYQQDNAATLAVGNINRWIKDKVGPGGYVPYRLVTLFQKTPINILGEVLSFTPGVGMMMLKSAKMTPRERNILLSKQIVGTVAVGAFSQLYDKGIISAPMDTPEESEKARQLALSNGTMPPASINLSALSRYTKGESPKIQSGDNVVDLSVMGVGGALASMVGMAKRVKEQSRTGESDILATSWGAVLGNLNFVMQQSFLKGTSDFINLVNSNPKQSFQKFAKNMLTTAASPVAPNILASIDRADRQYVPVLKEDTILGSFSNEMNRRMKVLGLAIPGSTEPDKLPLKRDLWGNAIAQTPVGSNPWVYNLLDPIRMKTVQSDPLNADVYRLWRKTGEERAIPGLPLPNIEFRGVKYEKMTPDQYDRYAQLIGYYRRTFAEKVYMSGAFSRGTDQAKLDLLGRAYSLGQKVGKYQFLKELKEKGESLTPLTARRGFVETE